MRIKAEKDSYVFISKDKIYAQRFVNYLSVSLVPKIWIMQEQEDKENPDLLHLQIRTMVHV